jgi:hypothetical protein
MMIKKTNLGLLLLASAAFSFVYIGYINEINFAVAQTNGTTDLGTETIEDFEKIEGNDSAIIRNDTAISNPNNTLLDSTEVNMEENCMVLPDGSNYCP